MLSARRPLRLQVMDDVRVPVPFQHRLMHRAVLFLDVRRHLDDFQHAGQVRRGIDIDDAHAARRDVGEDFRVAERRLAIDGGGSLGLAD